jgi:lipoprotein-anchoring transpeptidase ErfK/SrfK
MAFRCVRWLAVLVVLLLSITGLVAVPPSVSEAHASGILLFVAPSQRRVTAGAVEKVWVHTMAHARVTLRVAYGNGQSITRRGLTDRHGTHLFTWSVDYTGARATVAHYRVDVTRGDLSTAARGTFLLLPAPALHVRMTVLTPQLADGDALRLLIHSRPGADLALRVRGNGRTLLAIAGVADAQGNWDVATPLDVPVSQAQRLRVVVTATDLGRRASAASSVSVQPALAPQVSGTGAINFPIAPTASFAQARSEALAAAQGSWATAQGNARQAVQALSVDLQVLAQWTAALPVPGVAHDTALLAQATSYNDLIDVTARAVADDSLVQARMRAVMPHKAIMISLAQQTLRAYEDGRLQLVTYVTTGGPELPTPPGHFQILARFSPFTFVSPYPTSSPWWYPPSPVTWAMLFQQNGYYIHDAPWRSFYGPGSNVVYGAPGTNGGGSHGCVNTPYTAMAWLWNWTPIGTPVVVY